MTKSTMSIAGPNQRPTRPDNQQAGPAQAVEARLEVHVRSQSRWRMIAADRHLFQTREQRSVSI